MGKVICKSNGGSSISVLIIQSSNMITNEIVRVEIVIDNSTYMGNR
jgi:hypothetical protein